MKMKFILVTLAACLCISPLALYLSYQVFKPPEGKQAALGYVAAAEIPPVATPLALAVSPSTSPTPPSATITAGTVFRYETVYQDGQVEQSQELAPYFLQGKDQAYLAAQFLDWQIVSFSADEVVMRRTLSQTSGESYIIGEQDGYVAVFYTEPVNGSRLKEVTSTPLAALSPAEQDKIKQGIPVEGNDQLALYMQDYGS